MTETELKIAVSLPTFLPILLFILIILSIILGIKLYQFMDRTTEQLTVMTKTLEKFKEEKK